MRKGDAVDSCIGRFLLRSERLLPGDVIVTRTPGSFVSGAIRLSTGANYSHALICTRPPICVESSDYGVVRLSVDRFLVNDRDNVAILRLRDRQRYAAELLDAAQYAEDQVSRDYADTDMLTALFTFIPAVEDGKYFCSQLVACAFKHVGISLVADTEPAKTTPGEIAASPLLYDVTTDCIVEADEGERAIRLGTRSFLDAPSGQSPHEEEVELRRAIVHATAAMFPKVAGHASVFGDLIKILIDGLRTSELWVGDVDTFIAERMRSSGLLDLVRKHVPADCDYFFYDIAAMRWGFANRPSHSELKERIANVEKTLRKANRLLADVAPEVLVKRDLWIRSDLETVRLDLAVSYEVLFHHQRLQLVASGHIRALRWLVELLARG